MGVQNPKTRQARYHWALRGTFMQPPINCTENLCRAFSSSEVLLAGELNQAVSRFQKVSENQLKRVQGSSISTPFIVPVLVLCHDGHLDTSRFL